jgi:hypothetical protein
MINKIAPFVILLMLTGAYSFAADSERTRLGVQGTGDNGDQVAFFVDALTAEASASGYEIASQTDFRSADYGLKFEIVHNTNVIENRFFLNISLIRVKDLSTLASASYGFSELEDMAPYTQYLFYKLTASIPGRGGAESTAWRNKWLYLRFSFDYPITIYELNPLGLVAGPALYRGEFDDPDEVMPLDNRISALPGATVGIELQMFNWLSLEVNANVAMEEFFGEYYYTLSAAAELKFPIKVKNFMIEPYGIFTYPFMTPKDVFEEFPKYGYGGGLQVNVRGGSIGAFFIDVNYIYMPVNALMKNPYIDLFPKPEIIHWRRYVIGLGVGYKLGLISKR